MGSPQYFLFSLFKVFREERRQSLIGFVLVKCYFSGNITPDYAGLGAGEIGETGETGNLNLITRRSLKNITPQTSSLQFYICV